MLETIRQGSSIGLLEIVPSKEEVSRWSGILSYAEDGSIATVRSEFLTRTEEVFLWANRFLREIDLKSELIKLAAVYSLDETIVMDPHVDGLWTIVILPRRGTKALRTLIPSEIYFSSKEKAEEAVRTFFKKEERSDLMTEVRRRTLS